MLELEYNKLAGTYWLTKVNIICFFLLKKRVEREYKVEGGGGSIDIW